MTYDYGTVTTSYNATTTTSSAVPASSVPAEGGLFSQKAASTEVDSLLSANSGSIADIEAKLANVTDEEAKQILLAEKQRLVEEKAKLQAKQLTLQNDINVAKTEFEASQTRLNQLKNDLQQLQDKKSRYASVLKADSDLLKEKKEAITDTESNIANVGSDLTTEIAKMQAGAKKIEDESHAELQSQRQAVAQASLIAEQRVKSGEMKQEDIPAFIASQVGSFTSTGSTGRTDELSSQNTKVKAYCKRLGSLITKKIGLESYASALSSKVASSGELISSMDNEIGAKVTSINAEKSVYSEKLNTLNVKNSEYQVNASQMDIIDTRMQAIDTRYAQYNSTTPTQAAQASAATSGSSSAAAKNTGEIAATVESSDYSSFDNIFEKINNDFTSAIAQPVLNADVAEYQSKVDEAEGLIVTLRHKLSDDAQKIIEERLAATRRQ